MINCMGFLVIIAIVLLFKEWGYEPEARITGQDGRGGCYEPEARITGQDGCGGWRGCLILKKLSLLSSRLLWLFESKSADAQ